MTLFEKDYNPGSIRVFPKFLKKSEGEISGGTPIARLGFSEGQPYSHGPVTWNAINRSFHWDSEKIKLFFFCNDGFVTGYTDLELDTRFLETNSLGLNGQSGGLIFTAQGIIAGITSRNSTFEGKSGGFSYCNCDFWKTYGDIGCMGVNRN